MQGTSNGSSAFIFVIAASNAFLSVDPGAYERYDKWPSQCHLQTPFGESRLTMGSFSIAGTLKIPNWAEEDMARNLGLCRGLASCAARRRVNGREVAEVKLRLARGTLYNGLE